MFTMWVTFLGTLARRFFHERGRFSRFWSRVYSFFAPTSFARALHLSILLLPHSFVLHEQTFILFHLNIIRQLHFLLHCLSSPTRQRQAVRYTWHVYLISSAPPQTPHRTVFSRYAKLVTPFQSLLSKRPILPYLFSHHHKKTFLHHCG